MAKKDEIKEKNIEDPYELPEGWKWVRLRDICDKAFSGKSPKYSKEKTPYKIIGQQANQRYGIDLSFIKYGTKEYADAQADFYYLQYNDVLLNTLGTGSIGRSGIYKYNERILTDGHPFVFRTGTKFSSDLLFYYLRLNEEEIINTANGSTNQKFLSLKSFLNFLIPLPPTFEEQQRIVNRIESMFAKLDEAKEKAQNVVDSFENRKAANLHQAFTGTLTAKWRKENGISDDSWEEKKLEEVCEFITKGTTPKKEDMSIGFGDSPYIKVYNLCFDTSLDFTVDPTFVKKESHEKFLARSITLPGDVLMNIVGPPFGKVSIVPDDYPEWNINQAIARFRCKEELLNLYLANYLISPKTIENISKQIKTTAGQQNLTLEICRNINILVPTLPEQQEIVHILDAVLEKERTAKSAAEQVLEQIDLLKKSILARAFRGEL